MKKNASMQQMLLGDISAFEEWMDRYAGHIERFAIQYGCTREQARDVTEEVFRSFYMNWGAQREKERIAISPYQMILEKLDRIPTEESLDTSILPFEEDRQLHEKITRLGSDAKTSLILSYFHHMDDAEIAKHLGISAEAVRDIIDGAVQQLAEDHDRMRFGKQLDFLKLSYERIPPLFQKEQVLIEDEMEIQEIIKTKTSKKGMIPWLVGIVILLALIVTSIVTSEEYQQKAAEKYLERLQETFEEEMAKRFALLGLPEQVGEDVQMPYMTFYGSEARLAFQQLVRRQERELIDTGRIDRKNVKEQYAAIIDTLALPSEMVEELIKKPLTKDREQSELFIEEYLERYYGFQHAYQMLLSEYSTVTEEAMVNGEIDLEQTTYPEELQKAMKGMMTQNIYPTVIPQWNSIIPIFQKNEISAQIRASLHEDLGGYVTVLESAPFVIYPDLAYPYDESVEYLLDMEKTLLTSWGEEDLHFMLDYSYKELLYTLIGGYESDHIYGQDGTVKEEVRAAWQKIASNGGASPSAAILQKIIREMEASNWTESESRKRVTVHHISHAIILARDGQLQSLELTGVISTGQDFDIVSFPDVQFERLVEETYERFSAEHDRTLLQEVHPLVIFSMFILANNREDIETMEYLYESQTFEEYINDWKNVNIDLYQLDHLQFNKLGGHAGAIWLEKGQSSSGGTEMTKNQENVWLVKYFHYDTSIFE